MSFTRSSPYATDIICKGNSKLSCIVKVSDRYGFELDEVMLFGDSNNDFEMLN
ncbi:HAD hydrolase family protein [Streptococcus suis]